MIYFIHQNLHFIPYLFSLIIIFFKPNLIFGKCLKILSNEPCKHQRENSLLDAYKCSYAHIATC